MRLQSIIACLDTPLSDKVGHTQTRNSNVELLRLLCMWFILVHHFITHAIFGMEMVIYGGGELSSTSSIAILLNAFCYVGVNCFLLISGYFGLRFRWRNLLNFYLILVFYSIITLIFEYVMSGEFQGLKYYIDQAFTARGFSRWWFMERYIIFFLLAPIVNVDGWNKQQYRKILVLLTIVNIFLAYWMKRYSNGFSVAQFLYMYVIGGYIRRFVDVQRIKGLWLFAIYCASSLLFGGFSLLRHYCVIPHWNAEAYNNPLLVISAIALFCFVLRFNFHSKVVNWLASSALAIYLIQYMPFMRRLVQWSEQWLSPKESLPDLLLVLLCSSLLFMVAALAIDQLRKLLVRPIMSLYDHYSQKLSSWGGKCG